MSCQGAVTVFGAYANWTDDNGDTDNVNYCPNPVFMAAFVWLILQWIMLPCIVCQACFAYAQE